MRKIFFWLPVLLLLAGCYDDKGNYTYSEIPEIKLEGVEDSYSLLKGAGTLEFSPKVISSVEGEIGADNPNFEYECWIGKTAGRFASDNEMWHDMNPDKTQAFSYRAAEDEGSYVGRYIVRDKRTGVATNFKFSITISSTVYEGWMVLCNEGDDNRVRMDMISVVSPTETLVAHDIMNSTFPLVHNATQIALDRSIYASGDYIYLFSKEGSYRLNQTTLAAEKADNIVDGEFLMPLENDMPIRFCPIVTGWVGADAHLVTTLNGDMYSKIMGVYGAGYEFLVNTSNEGGKREFHVAPYIATGMERPGTVSNALLYDKDNKRFMGWDAAKANGRACFDIPDPENKLFSYKTGKDLLYMEGTRFSNNLVYAVLQDASGARSVYGINLSGSIYTQEAYYENIKAENFEKAQHFTFHSQYPYMFYGAEGKVYSYNLVTGKLTSVSLGADEDITMVKIDLFKSMSLKYVPEDILPQQYYVLVGSYKKGSTDKNGGILRMYKLDATTGELSLVREDTGFAKIQDVTYRERFRMM